MNRKGWRSWGVPPTWWGMEPNETEVVSAKRHGMPHQFWFDGCPHCRLPMPQTNTDFRIRYMIGFSDDPIFREPEEKSGITVYDRDGAATIRCPRCQKLSSIHIYKGMTRLYDKWFERDGLFLRWPEAREAYAAMVAERDREE